MFRPLPPTFRSLSGSFVLNCVAAISSAPDFTTTMAESANPWPITFALLQCLEICCRIYSVSVPVALSPGKTNNSIPVYPPPILASVTEKILGFRSHGYSAPDACLTEVHFRLGYSFGSTFLQIPHWLLPNHYSLIR